MFLDGVWVSYYRLKQADFNGDFEYSEIRALYYEDREVFLFPNPAKDFLTVKTNDLSAIHIFSLLGQDLTEIIKIQKTGNQQFKIDISELKSGSYSILINDTFQKFTKL